MKRRDVLMAGAGVFGTAAIGAAGGAVAWTSFEVGNSQDDSKSLETVDNAPAKVEEARPLAQAFLKHIRKYYPNARVFISKKGYLSMEFPTDAESAEEVKTEFHRIAVEYVNVVEKGEYEPNTISLITSNVKAIVTEPAVTAHITGEINQEAFLKTIEVSGVERRTESGGK